MTTNGQNLEVFPLRSGKEWDTLCAIDMVLGILATAIIQGEEKRSPNRKRKKLNCHDLVMYVLILSIDNLQIPGITVRISEYITVEEHKMNNNWLCKPWIKRLNPFMIARKNDILKNKADKEIKGLRIKSSTQQEKTPKKILIYEKIPYLWTRKK